MSVVTIKRQKIKKWLKSKFYENWPKFLFGQKIFKNQLQLLDCEFEKKFFWAVHQMNLCAKFHNSSFIGVVRIDRQI